MLSELVDMDPMHERFDAKVTVLMENVRHHVEEEEGDFFPKVRKQLGRNELADLGDTLAAAKQSAATKPHPRMPDALGPCKQRHPDCRQAVAGHDEPGTTSAAGHHPVGERARPWHQQEQQHVVDGHHDANQHPLVAQCVAHDEWDEVAEQRPGDAGKQAAQADHRTRAPGPALLA